MDIDELIPEKLLKIAGKYGVSVRRDVYNCGKDYGAYAGKMIMLGSFTDPQLEEVAFFHELGHVVSPTVTKRGFTMTTLSAEGLAWELGLGIAFEHGYEWDRDSHVMIWARNQLLSYMKPEHVG